MTTPETRKSVVFKKIPFLHKINTDHMYRNIFIDQAQVLGDERFSDNLENGRSWVCRDHQIFL